MDFLIYSDCQQAILEGVIPEDVRKGGGNDSLYSPAGDCPGCVFSGGSAAEIITSQQDFGMLIFWLVEDKILLGGPVRVETPVGKQSFCHAGLVGYFQVSSRNDLVGVDVLVGKGDGDRGY